jgi:hypothetical protein
VLTASFLLPFLLRPELPKHGHAQRNLIWGIAIAFPLLKRWYAPNAKTSTYPVSERENFVVELVMFFIICGVLATLGDAFGH